MAATPTTFITSKPAQLIEGDGSFNKGVGRELDFDNDKGRVGVVSIMGVQSSGKSTLMNKCFSTSFKEMNQETGMSQTTKGIWMSKISFPGDSGHKILLLDCEGSDGAERGQEGNDKFEKQVTLFALASSDVVMINMKCDSVNLYNGAGMPLIRNVFQVMVRKFNTPRHVSLVFVLRDKNKVPLEKLRSQLKKQLTETWDNMCKDLADPPTASLEEYFKVEVVPLSHYLYAEEAFMAEVGDLRNWVFDTVEKGKLNAAASFINLTQTNWSDIQADKVLNLQQNQNSVDEQFFKITKEEIMQKFCQDKGWKKMKGDVRTGEAKGFGQFVSSLIESHVSMFNEETKSFNEKLRQDSTAQLTESLLEVVEESYHAFLKTKKQSFLDKFENQVQKKIDALDGNFDVEAYKTEFYNTIKEAHITQAPAGWGETYERFTGVEPGIKKYIDFAHKSIEDLARAKEEAEKQAQKGGGNFLTDLFLGPPLPLQLGLMIAKAIAPDSSVVKDIDEGIRGFQREFRSTLGLGALNG